MRDLSNGLRLSSIVTEKDNICIGLTAKNIYLKLYCRYLYTRPCMINHIWGLKQL